MILRFGIFGFGVCCCRCRERYGCCYLLRRCFTADTATVIVIVVAIAVAIIMVGVAIVVVVIAAAAATAVAAAAGANSADAVMVTLLLNGCTICCSHADIIAVTIVIATRWSHCS